MLIVDPQKRANLDQLLKHSWIRLETADGEDIYKLIEKDLKETVSIMFSCWIAILLLSAWSALATEPAVNITRRYEFLYSFKPPMLAQQNGEIPFFEHGGQAIASTESIRLTPSMVNKKGWVWSKKKANFSGFDAEFSFRVTGRGRIGADGLAFWYVSEKSSGGPVYGAGDKWNGLGLFFDTYDNDMAHNNPIVMAVLNNGSQVYQHELDGEGQQAGHCIRDFRNRPLPIRVKVHYFQGTIEVHVGHGMVEKEELDLCFIAQNVQLPSEGYFGLSAATGDLADDHDVYRLEVHSLHLPNEATNAGPSEEEREKFEKEYAEYYEKLQKAEEEFKKQQEAKPEKERKKSKHVEEEESEAERHLRQIWESQANILQLSKEAGHKLDAVAEQLRTWSKSPPSGSSGGASSVTLPEDLLRRSDVQTHMDGLQTSLNFIKTRVEELQNSVKLLRDNNKPVVDTGYDQHKLHNELRDTLNDLREKVVAGDKQVEEHLRQQLQQEFSRLTNTVSRDCASCVSTNMFLLVLVLQTALLVAFLLYQQHRDNSAKKFY